jgi:hypothetical protein
MAGATKSSRDSLRVIVVVLTRDWHLAAHRWPVLNDRDQQFTG